ncbi:MvdC/MvdD family ATP grasp protein [Cryptosporangium minutisporangium]|uniref:ATP-grasp ribosomal peptide maturase n=1 Tax=Cryptosporangium minutisporangium TaxID=113569 RepID=A0ABP6SZC8_9ACTN
MSSAQIVISTNVFDAHTDVLIDLLVRRGHEPIRVNSSELPGGAVLSARLDGPEWTGTLHVTAGGRTFAWEDVTAVWWRKPTGFGLPADLSEWEREFAEEELRHATGGLWASLDCYWMSRPDDIRRAGYKLEQLQRARRLGLAVPRTLISSDPAAVREFADDCDGRIVYKVLTDPYLMAGRTVDRNHDADVEPRFVATTLVTAAELAALESTVRTVPCQFQEFVEKRVEYRVTVIGDDLFVAEISPADGPPPGVDWRTETDRLRMRPGSLPDDVAEACLALVRSYGLQFSAIDLVRDRDGRLLFLESNPNGQFLHVEQRVPELRMADAVATRLITGR